MGVDSRRRDWTDAELLPDARRVASIVPTHSIGRRRFRCHGTYLDHGIHVNRVRERGYRVLFSFGAGGGDGGDIHLL